MIRTRASRSNRVQRAHLVRHEPAHGLRNVHLYEGEQWIHVRDAVGDLADKFLVLNEVYPDGFYIPKRFIGENIIHLPTIQTVRWRSRDETFVDFLDSTQCLSLGRTAALRLKARLKERSAE